MECVNYSFYEKSTTEGEGRTRNPADESLVIVVLVDAFITSSHWNSRKFLAVLKDMAALIEASEIPVTS